MTGWQRLWVVCSILFGVPAGGFAYAINDRSYAEVAYHAGEGDAFWQRAYATEKLKDCNWQTAKADSSFEGTSFVTCDTKHPLEAALPWAILPGLILGVIGWTIAWIRRGFRQENHNL